jgi:HPt (histidine-containing phosphotransfer) domain-containing protein
MSDDSADEVLRDGRLVLDPPTRLRAKVRLLPAGAPDPIERAERALAAAAVDDPRWLAETVARVFSTHEAARASSYTEPRLGDFYRALHDMRGQAPSLGYPLLAQVADSLCGLLDLAKPHAPEERIVAAHVDAVRAMMREGAAGDGSPLARALAGQLAELTRGAARRAFA